MTTPGERKAESFAAIALVGGALGAGVGFLTGNIALGIVVGLFLGVGIGACFLTVNLPPAGSPRPPRR